MTVKIVYLKFKCIIFTANKRKLPADMAELVDAPDLGSGGEIRGGSSPPLRTNILLKEVIIGYKYNSDTRI